MHEHIFQKTAVKIFGLVGYFLGPIFFLISISMIAYDFANWSSHLALGAVGIAIFYLADLMISSRQRMDFLLKIMQKQQDLESSSKPKKERDPISHLEMLKHIIQSRPGSNPETSHRTTEISIDKDGISVDGDSPPPEILEMLSNLGKAFKGAMEESKKENIETMSIKQLNDKLEAATQKQDFEKAAFLRDVIKKRQDAEKKGDSENEEEKE